MNSIEDYHSYVLSEIKLNNDLINPIYLYPTFKKVDEVFHAYKNENNFTEYYKTIKGFLLNITQNGGKYKALIMDGIILEPKEYFKIKQRKDKLNKLL